ncbi:AAA family ATPase [Thermoflexus sp.]|jgi:exonuclease SbcC|uniref:AAA family ATPase n=1 Tax=Thermoflexus sp. TaxID=1969742 RepID=UPI003C116289
MELVRLELKNFLSYREGVLDFNGLRMAALVGPNGAGKSSLLDAITWALWGKTSRLDRDQDLLVHRGEKEARVSLTFRLGEALYQVTRTRRRGKGSTLDFQMLAPRRRSLTGSGLRETERLISQTLGIDFETFVNSAFIRQGRADEFTTKTPAERKDVLAEILQLRRWTELEERAKEKIRRIDQELETLRWRIQECEKELAQRPQREADLQKASAEHLARQEEREKAEKAWEELRRDEERAREVQGRLRELQAQRQEVENSLARLEEQIRQQEESLRRWRALLERRAVIEAAWEALQRARRELARMDEASRTALALRERRAELEKQIAVARAQLEGERQRLQREIEAARDRASRLPDLEREAADLRERLSRQPALEQEIRALEERLQTLQAERVERQSENRRLHEEMRDLKARIQAIAQIGAECPTCRRPLPDAERERLRREWEEEGRRRADRYRENQNRLQALEQEQAEAAARLEERRQALSALARFHSRLEQIEGERADILREKERLADLETALREVERRLQEDLIAPEEQAELRRIDEALRDLGYDVEAHHALIQRIRALEEEAQDWPRLQEAEQRVPQEEEALRRLESLYHDSLERRERILRSIGELEQAGQALAERLKALPEAQRRLEEARRAEREARDRLIAAEQRLKILDQLEQERQSLQKEILRLEEEKGLYRDLQLAFSRNGVPAMIIEAILPEIEEEANRILHRLTDGRLTVRFRSQRETKEGNVRETLDILISDEGEERPYENFSGGEKFRVDFAIRLALSRILARRSGTPLRLLVVDEGFGSQDQAGRERLIEALNAIKDEFATILVISHLEEFQDAFPVRIEVRKTAAGSQLHVVR